MTMQKKQKLTPEMRMALARKQFDLARREMCDNAAVSYQLDGRGAVMVTLWDDGDPDQIHYAPREDLRQLLADMGVKEDTAHVLELIDAYQPGKEFVAFILYPVEQEADGVIYVAAAILTREKDTRVSFSSRKSDFLKRNYLN